MHRKEVYKIIDQEREYQSLKWNERTTDSNGFHSITEFLVFIRDYTEEALHAESRMDEKSADEFATHNVRKIAALAVACMEQNGALKRS